MHYKKWVVEWLIGSLKLVRNKAVAILQANHPQGQRDITTQG